MQKGLYMKKLILTSAFLLTLLAFSSSAGLVDAGFDGSRIWADVRGPAGTEFTAFLYIWDDDYNSWSLRSQGNYVFNAGGRKIVQWDVNGHGKAYVKVMDQDGYTQSEEIGY